MDTNRIAQIDTVRPSPRSSHGAIQVSFGCGNFNDKFCCNDIDNIFIISDVRLPYTVRATALLDGSSQNGETLSGEEKTRDNSNTHIGIQGDLSKTKLTGFWIRLYSSFIFITLFLHFLYIINPEICKYRKTACYVSCHDKNLELLCGVLGSRCRYREAYNHLHTEVRGIRRKSRT